MNQPTEERAPQDFYTKYLDNKSSGAARLDHLGMDVQGRLIRTALTLYPLSYLISIFTHLNCGSLARPTIQVGENIHISLI